MTQSLRPHGASLLYCPHCPGSRSYRPAPWPPGDPWWSGPLDLLGPLPLHLFCTPHPAISVPMTSGSPVPGLASAHSRTEGGSLPAVLRPPRYQAPRRHRDGFHAPRLPATASTLRFLAVQTSQSPLVLLHHSKAALYPPSRALTTPHPHRGGRHRHTSRWLCPFWVFRVNVSIGHVT